VLKATQDLDVARDYASIKIFKELVSKIWDSSERRPKNYQHITSKLFPLQTKSLILLNWHCKNHKKDWQECKCKQAFIEKLWIPRAPKEEDEKDIPKYTDTVIQTMARRNYYLSISQLLHLRMTDGWAKHRLK
jgi:hypothetical protein